MRPKVELKAGHKNEGLTLGPCLTDAGTSKTSRDNGVIFRFLTGFSLIKIFSRLLKFDWAF